MPHSNGGRQRTWRGRLVVIIIINANWYHTITMIRFHTRFPFQNPCATSHTHGQLSFTILNLHLLADGSRISAFLAVHLITRLPSHPPPFALHPHPKCTSED